MTDTTELRRRLREALEAWDLVHARHYGMLLLTALDAEDAEREEVKT